MRTAIFCHSLVSDWNHGNAHFLRGIVAELLERGVEVTVYEPEGGWSLSNLVADQGSAAVGEFEAAFPSLRSESYDLATVDVPRLLEGHDLVLVHEWSDRRLIAAIGDYRRSHDDIRILFHDTHHRAATAPEKMEVFQLERYDGVLAFGGVIAEIYLDRSWADRVWVWHEAADTRTFYPRPEVEPSRDLVWIGNWGDGERTEELYEYLLGPVGDLGLTAVVHGVCYPEEARQRLADSGAEYRGWIANHKVPDAFAASRMTVHVPRRPYVEALAGIPTIRVFEALACGIPLISAPWDDAEGLFRAGTDYLVAHDREQMTRYMKEILNEPQLANDLARSGLETIRARHTCSHRVDELMTIAAEVGVEVAPQGSNS